MNLIYPPQRIVLIWWQLDLIRVVCLAGEAEFLDQDAVRIILVVYQCCPWSNGIFEWLECHSLGRSAVPLKDAQNSVLSASEPDSQLVGRNASQLGSLRRPLDVLGTDGIVDLIEVYTSWKQLYFREVGPQNEEYLLQPVSGGGEGVTIIPGIRVNADVAEDIQRVIYPFTGVNVFPQSRHQYRCIWLPVCPKRLMRYD